MEIPSPTGGSGVSPDGFPPIKYTYIYIYIYIYALRIKRDYEYG